MLTNSNNQIRQTSRDLALTTFAKGTAAVLLFALSAQLEAGQHGRPYGSDAPTDHSSAHVSHSNPTPAPTNRGWGRPGNVTPHVNIYDGRMNHNPGPVTRVTNTTTTYVHTGRDRGFGPEGFVGREHVRYIPEHHFRSQFGREHVFHVDRQVILGGHRRFQFGGVAFGIAQPWPAAWRETDPVYVDYVAGAYMLCNRMQPGIRIPVNVDECATCGQAPVAAPMVTATPAACTQCVASGNSNPAATLTLGQTIGEVVAILGSPVRAVDLGAKQIYVYQDMKVTFIDGRISDVS